MAGRVNDVDAGGFPFHRGGFGQNGDAALAFQIIAVHGALGHGLIGTKSARLFQQFIHEGGFAMINMRDDRNIAKIHIWCPFVSLVAARLSALALKGQSR